MSWCPIRDPGSFRDPSGYVFHDANRVFRAITEAGWSKFEDVVASGTPKLLADRRLMIECFRIETSGDELAKIAGARDEKIVAVYEHPKIPFISYPYEWVFSQLKDAALTHLDLQLLAFDEGYVLSDATAFNMQFINGQPLHIDVMSLRRYVDGELWAGYNQYCRQFLLPLLVEAWSGLPYQALYRGSLEGISFRDALAILPRYKYFLSPSALVHVFLHGKAVLKSSSSTELRSASGRLSPKGYRAILKQLRDYISGLESRNRAQTYWNRYAIDNSYSDCTRNEKLQFVKEWAARCKPETIFDIGGNTGDFSRAALEGGASRSILLDSDIDSVEVAYSTCKRNGEPILPLLMNFLDPSPDMGWRQQERQGLANRARADGIIALAVIHHLVIGGSLPLSDVIQLLMDMAPCGIIEFVPKEDPMVVGLLKVREDTCSDYSEEVFRRVISSKGRIVAEQAFSDNGRLLVAYEY